VRNFDANIYVRIFDPSLGLVRTDTIPVGSLGHPSNPSITAFADSSYVISYTFTAPGGTSSNTDIVARVVSASGTVGAQFNIDNDTDAQNFSEVATLPNGNFVVVYRDQFNGSSTDTDIIYAVFSPAGTPVAGPNIVAGGGGALAETDPDVAALREGGFVVVWTDPDTTETDIRATLMNSVGTPLRSNILVNTTTTGAQNEASVVALADGGFLVTWEDDFANLVRGQRFDAAGNKIGSEFTVKNGDDGTTSVDSPEAALLADGGRIAYAIGDVSTGDRDVTTSMWRTRDVSHDFDGDGKSGVLWRHDSGQVYFWEMNGLGIQSEGSVAHAWRHDSGPVYIWEMDGLGTKAEGGVAHAPVPNDWQIQGTGDFNGDGHSDILWRHDGGQVYIWEMDGLGIKAEGSVVHAAVPNDYHILGLGDFDGDGKNDILWRHDSGQVYIWEMNGLQVKAEGTVMHAPVGNDWHVEDIGDYNNDGKSGDILWRHDSGQVYTWEMNGLQITAEGSVPHAAVPSDWHIFSQHNFV
jgi:hypothetical protein